MCEYEWWVWNCGYAVERFVVTGSQEQKCPSYPNCEPPCLPSKCRQAKIAKSVIVNDDCYRCKIEALNYFWVCEKCGNINRDFRSDCKRTIWHIPENENPQGGVSHDDGKYSLPPCGNKVVDPNLPKLHVIIDSSRLLLIGIVAENCSKPADDRDGSISAKEDRIRALKEQNLELECEKQKLLEENQRLRAEYEEMRNQWIDDRHKVVRLNQLLTKNNTEFLPGLKPPVMQ